MEFGIGCIALGLLFIVFSVFSSKKRRDHRGACTVQVYGKVIGYEETLLKDQEGVDTWAFCPRFRYLVKDKPVEATADWGTINPRFREGQTVSLYYDPEQPTKIYTDDNRRTNGSLIGGGIFGLLLIVYGICLLLGFFSV